VWSLLLQQYYNELSSLQVKYHNASYRTDILLPLRPTQGQLDDNKTWESPSTINSMARRAAQVSCLDVVLIPFHRMFFPNQSIVRLCTSTYYHTKQATLVLKSMKFVPN
jgi:hypothetical protein